jgi:hypothetical protein
LLSTTRNDNKSERGGNKHTTTTLASKQRRRMIPRVPFSLCACYAFETMTEQTTNICILFLVCDTPFPPFFPFPVFVSIWHSLLHNSKIRFIHFSWIHILFVF